MARVFNSIGNIYKEQGDLSGALDYFQKALKLTEELGVKNGIAANHTNAGGAAR